MRKILKNWFRSVNVSLIGFTLVLSIFLFSVRPAHSADSLKDCTKTSVGFSPLIEMSGDDYYPNTDHPSKVNGGLYGNGSNNPPESHWQQAQDASAAIIPRDANGNPDAGGRIGLISLGMSNTSSEFDTFMRLIRNYSQKSPAVTAVNGAQPAMTAYWWAYPSATRDPWINFNLQIQNAGLTKAQIQVVWMKLTEMSPKPGSDNFPVFAYRLRDEMAVIAKRLKQDYPNIQIIYLSSRIYAGYSLSPQSPEPFAYEGGFSNRWLIEDQINGGLLTGVSYANAPVLLWGPYLWADGLNPNSEALIWECADFIDDGVHPSKIGNTKVSQKLLTFLTTDPLAAEWFNLPLTTTPIGTPTSSETPLATNTLTPTAPAPTTDTPTATPSPTPASTPTPTASPPPIQSATPTASSTPTPTSILSGEPLDYVAGWKFDEGTGALAYDESANGNTFTLTNGASWGSGHSGMALSLDGTNDYAARTDAELVGSFPTKSTDAAQHFTLSAWIMLDLVGRNQPIFTKQAFKIRGFDFYVNSANKLSLEVFSGNFVSTIASSSETLSAGTWTHVAATYDYLSSTGSVIKLYINGSLDSTVTNAVGPLLTNTQPLVMGWYSMYNWYLDGLIDEARVYARVLSEQEIAALAK